MATYNKFDIFVKDKNEGIHDMATDTLRIALTNTLPVATNSVIANITEIAYTNLSGDPTSRDTVLTSSSQTSGVYKLVLADLVLTAAGGAMAAFQWVVIYNVTQTTPLGPLVAWFDYGSALTLNDTETLTLNFDDINGLYQDT